MSSKWQGLVQEKLFLVQSLLTEAAKVPDPVLAHVGARSRANPRISGMGLQVGLIQGSIALLLLAREALLVLTAQLNQSKAVDLRTLDDLAEAVGRGNSDFMRLAGMSQNGGSWWYRLDELQHWVRQPREVPRRDPDDSLIAVVAASSQPDASPQALLELTAEIKRHVVDLCQWHGEW